MDNNLHNELNLRDIHKKINRQEHGRRRKAAIRRKKARRRNIKITILTVLILLTIIAFKVKSCVNKPDASNNTSQNEINVQTEKNKETEAAANKPVKYIIGAPKTRTKSEVYQSLKRYAKKDGRMAELYDKREQYTVDMLNKAVNNPEMTNFILGYPTAENTVNGGFTRKEKNAKYPHFTQWDSRWGYVSYGEDNIGISGCGPTCLSMVILTLTRNVEATPDNIARFSMDNGYYVEGTGTAWALMTDISEKYNVASYQIPVEEQTMKDELDKGRMLICSVGPGDFTTAGHFIVIYGYDGNRFFVNDPYCIARSERKWAFETLANQMRAIWTYRSTE